MPIDNKTIDDQKVEKAIKSITQFEFDRRIKLDVSNPDYINPSLGHYKISKQ